MKIYIDLKVEREIENCNFLELTNAFLGCLGVVFGQVVGQALRHYGSAYKESGKLNQLLETELPLTWKQLNGSLSTNFHTIFGKICVPQIQVYIHHPNGKKESKNITRLLLGISAYQRIPDFMKKLMGFLSSLCSYRVAQKCVGLVGNWNFGLGSFRRAVVWLADRIDFSACLGESLEFVADGTGISTLHTGKRGSELKILAQFCKNGCLRVVGMGVGKYMAKQEWKELFAPLGDLFKGQLNQLSVLMDGCKGIMNGAKSIHERIKIQRDIWHICHQLKYYMWKDKVPKIHKIALIKNVFKAVTMSWNRSKSDCLELMGSILLFCDKNKYKSCTTYLMGCTENLFTYEEAQLTHKYSTKIERMMRTVNQRMDVGVWTDKGALAVAKIRLAHYYNGFTV